MKLTRQEAAIRLDIPQDMAMRHGIPARISEEELAELDSNPPQWLAQSRANRTGKRPVWVTLTCAVCGETETARPKKWWPAYTFVACDDHYDNELPSTPEGKTRSDVGPIGSKFFGVLDQ